MSAAFLLSSNEGLLPSFWVFSMSVLNPNIVVQVSGRNCLFITQLILCTLIFVVSSEFVTAFADLSNYFVE